MKTRNRISIAAAALTLGATPAIALAAAPATHPGKGHQSTVAAGSSTTGASHSQGHKPSQPGPGASMGAKAKAYGRFCQAESKKHVAGQRGTPFSNCVTAMAKVTHAAKNSSAKNPTVACKTESKKHVKGMRGTPYSQCVSAAAKLRKSEGSTSSSDTTTSTTTTSTTTSPTTTTSTSPTTTTTTAS